MFAALSFDRPPVEFEDLPSGLLAWSQDVGGFAAVIFVVWAIVSMYRRRGGRAANEMNAGAPALWPLYKCLLATIVIAYGIVVVVRFPEIMKWVASVSSDKDASFSPTQTRLEVWSMAIGGCLSILAVCLPVLLDLGRMRWRRIWALAKLSFKEAIRRRVLWVFSALLIIFLFGSWFLPYDELKPEDQVRNYVAVVYWAKTPLLLVVASLLAAFSIPNDVKQQTIHTILTKPVERFEIVLGRFLGYTLLMTLVLFGITTFSLLYVFRIVDEEARYESLKAREPLYGNLMFEENGRRKAEAENVGREWDYRSYINGPQAGMPAEIYAIWEFNDLPARLEKRKEIRCEFNFDIYRTTKGEENKGVFCTFALETWNWSRERAPEYEKERKAALDAGRRSADVDDELAAKYGYYKSPVKEVVNNHTLSINFPPGLVRNALQAKPSPAKDETGATPPRAPLLVRVQCISRTQFLGMAKYDLYFRLDEPDSKSDQLLFALNFFKASTGLWLRLCLVIGVAIACSTYLTGVISWLLTVFLFIAGYFRDFVKSLAEGTNFGGGPTKAFLDLIQRQNPLNESESSAVTQVATGSDVVFRWTLRRIISVIPDVDRFDFSDKLREGFDISGGQLLINFLLLTGYLLPWAILAYYLMKSREVAAS